MPSAPLVRQVCRSSATRRSLDPDAPAPQHAAIVRRGLRSEEPFRARLHLDRADRIDHHAGRSLPSFRRRAPSPATPLRWSCSRRRSRRSFGAPLTAFADRFQRFAPRRDAEVVVLGADLRNDDAVGVVALVREAAEVAQPVIVDLGIDARAVAEDLSAAVADEDVAADVAAVADRLGRLEVPDARFEAELARGQRAGRADVGDAGATSSCRAASPETRRPRSTRRA